MQTMDSSIAKTQKRNLTDMQEKFLDVLFTEAQGNPREAARIAGYSEHSYPKVIRNLDEDGTTPQASIRLAAANSLLDRVGITKKDQLDINMKSLHGIFILPPKDGTNKDKEKS